MQVPQLAQRGRALINFQAGQSKATGALHRAMEAEMAALGINNDTLPDDYDEQLKVVDDALADSKVMKVRQLFGEWAAKAHGQACDEAFEEVRGELEPMLRGLDEGPATLEADPDFKPPSYWSKVWFHRTHGGWDNHEFTGYVHGELVHKMLVARGGYPGDIFAQRRQIASQAYRKHYDRILDMGASSGHYTVALQETFPDAEIWGVDISRRMLEHARRVANENGWAWKLFVREAENTGFESESFDLVTSYILLHEIPNRIIRACFEEAFRLLKPGGDFVMGDVQRYENISKLEQWRFEYLARHGGEPYWRSASTTDVVALCKEIGFVDVEGYGLEPYNHPYVIRARKPA